MRKLSKEEKKKKLEELRLKIGSITHSVRMLEKYISEYDDFNEKVSAFRRLLDNGYKIRQSDIQKFKDERWFQYCYINYASKQLINNPKNYELLLECSKIGEYNFRNSIENKKIKITQELVDKFRTDEKFIILFFSHASDKILMDPKNEQLLNYIFSMPNTPSRKITNRELLIKLVKTKSKIFSVDNELLKKNNYELFNFMIKNGYTCPINDEDLALKIIEIKNQNFVECIDEKIVKKPEILFLLLKNGLNPNKRALWFYSFDTAFIERCIDNNIELDISRNSNFLELYNNPKIKPLLLKYYNEEALGKLIMDGKFTDIEPDFSIEKLWKYLNANLIIKYKDKLKEMNLGDWYDKFKIFEDEKNISEKRNNLIEIIKNGFPNILKHVNYNYVDKEIFFIAIDNGLNDYDIIVSFGKKYKDDISLEQLEKLVDNYLKVHGYLYISNEPFNKIVINENDTDEIKQQKQKILNKINYLLVPGWHVEDLSFYESDYLYDELLKENDKVIISKMLSRILYKINNSSLRNSKVADKYYNLFVEYYNKGMIDLNQFSSISTYIQDILNNEENYKREIINGCEYIFDCSYVGMDLVEMIKFAVDVGYTSKYTYSPIRYLINTNPYILEYALKINNDYIDTIENIYIVEQNIDLIMEVAKERKLNSRIINDYFIVNNIYPDIKVKSLSNIYHMYNLSNPESVDALYESMHDYKVRENMDYQKLGNELLKNVDNSDCEDLIVYYIKVANKLEIGKALVAKNERLLEKLLEDNFEYIRYASDEYIEKNKDILLKKLISENQLSRYTQYDFVREYIYNIDDVLEAVGLCKNNSNIVRFFNPEFIKQNEFLALKISNCNLSSDSSLLSDYQFVKKYIPCDSSAFRNISYDMLKEHPDLLENYKNEQSIYCNAGEGLYRYLLSEKSEKKLLELLVYNSDVPKSLTDEELDKFIGIIDSSNYSFDYARIFSNINLFIRLFNMKKINHDTLNNPITDEILIFLIEQNYNLQGVNISKVSFDCIKENIEKIILLNGVIDNVTEIRLFKECPKYVDILKNNIKNIPQNGYYNNRLLFKYLEYDDVKDTPIFIEYCIFYNNYNVIKSVNEDVNCIINLINNGYYSILQYVNNPDLLNNNVFISALINSSFEPKINNASSLILNNEQYILEVIQNNPNIINNLPVNLLTGEDNKYIIEAINSGYSFSNAYGNSTPSIIRENPKYIMMLLEKSNNPLNIIGGLSPKIFNDVDNEIFGYILNLKNTKYNSKLDILKKYKNIMNNSIYIKKLIEYEIHNIDDLKYDDSILNIVELELIDGDIKQLLFDNMSLLANKINNNSKLLINKEICEQISMYNPLLVVEYAPKECISDVLILSCMVNGISIYNSEALQDETLAHLYSPTLDNLKLALSKGVKINTLNYRLINNESLELLIDNNYLDVEKIYELIYSNKIDSSLYYDVLKLIFKNEMLLNNNMIDFFIDYINSSYNRENVQGLINYCTLKSFALMSKEKLLRIFSEEEIEQRLNSENDQVKKIYIFKNSAPSFSLEKIVHTSDDLNIYFDSNGPKKKLFDISLLDEELFSSLFAHSDLKDVYTEYYKNTPEILNYINFCIDNGLGISKYIKNIDSIKDYFGKDNPTKLFFDVALFDWSLQHVFDNDNKELYDNYYNDSKEVLSYIHFCKKYSFETLSKFIGKLEDINFYFDENGFKYDLMIENLDLAFPIVCNCNDWEQYIQKEDEKAIFRLISENRKLYANLPTMELKRNIFKPEFFNKLYNCNLLDGIDYEEFLLNNSSIIHLLIDSISDETLINFKISKEVFIRIISNFEPDMKVDIDSLYELHSSLGVDLRSKVFNRDVIKNIDDFDIYKIVKYNLKNPFMVNFFDLYHDLDKFSLLKSLYNHLKKVSGDNLGGGTRFIIKLASAIDNDYELFNNVNRYLNIYGNSKLEYNVLCMIYGRKRYTSVDEMLYHKDDVQLNQEYYKNLSVITLKDDILSDLIGINYEEYQTFLERNMDLDTLIKVRKKIETKLKMIYEDDPIDYEYANYLEENLQQILIFEQVLDSLLSTINSTNDKEQLIKLLIEIKTNSDKYTSIRKFSLNLYDRLRQIYELDAQLTLTKISDVQREIEQNESVKQKVLKTIIFNDIEYTYYDLSTYEYALYAHADSDVDSLFNPIFDKNTALCLSPVSDRGLKGYYSDRIIYGYDSVANGAFIASSSRNTGSNGIFYNTIEISLDFLNTHYDQKEIKESSALQLYNARSHSETNIARDGMYPSCIIIRGEEPNPSEIVAAITLGKYLGLPDGQPAPMVKLQRVNTRLKEEELNHFGFSVYAHMDEREISDVIQSEEINLKKSELHRIKQAVSSFMTMYRQVEKVERFRRYKLRTGASHDIYKCRIDSKDYFVKPALDGAVRAPHRACAVVLGSNMQKLVNPDNAIDVFAEEYPIDGVDTLCSFLEDKKNTTDFDIVDNSNGFNFPNLTETQIEGFLRELIVDHLLFNYDTKGVNFLYDSNRVYGIDKEQALKFCTSSEYGGEGIVPTRQTGNGVAMYSVFLQHYKDKISQEKIVEIYTDVLRKVESISLVDFFKMYLPYLETTELTNEKIQSIIGRRLRLVSEVKDFVKSYFDVTLNYTERDLNYEISLLNNLLEEKELEKVVVENGRTK